MLMLRVIFYLNWSWLNLWYLKDLHRLLLKSEYDVSIDEMCDSDSVRERCVFLYT